LDEPRSDRRSQPRQCRGVEGNQRIDAHRTLLEEVPGLRDAGVVDEDLDAGVVAQPRLHGCEVGLRSQIGLKHIDLDTIGVPQACGRGIEAGFVARHQHEIMATPGEAVRVDGTDAAGCPGDENCRQACHG
jgi:hypothetical protein